MPDDDATTNDGDGDGDGDGDRLAALLAGRRVVVLTGAGCSTESGIPDYRGNGRPVRRPPIVHDAFVRSAHVRRRYWARATLGWPRLEAARPNGAHAALAALETAGVVAGVVTQNVDGLHQAAGSRTVIELHGALADVRCLDCQEIQPRREVQHRLLAANAGWLDRAAALAPDGDAEPVLAVDALHEAEASFVVVGCRSCGGTLMPRVVFFGGTVPRATVESAFALCDQAQALLVVGSSLAVYSGFRFVRRAAEHGVPIAIVNLGPTRADDLSALRVAARAGTLLPRLAARLAARR
jgi:NAD+-dependent protein deacetylase sirtuin 4